ncbi:hypothetical protein [Ovoidimarina sediminis]|uniref:hypothetical protein n=1 Tax=Ovoidimarina sediminis TaxID=3079856 RepID=UPI0029103ACD|nr:hypothetical protein [Rhodophyticola sp. MJ-SS7]MDU8945828.1 hypothetical protein [Rhodophyticola sp. MJ-SS7]
MGRHETSVIVHGGFHKTATTHLQGILKRNEKRLDRHGIRYIHHRATRKNFTVPVQLNAYLNLGLPRRRRIDDDTLRSMTQDFFDTHSEGQPRRIIMSDENMAGHCGQCVRGGTLYEYRRDFLEIFAREIPYRVSEVHMAIRGYADFFASAYVEFLRSVKRDSPPKLFVTEAKMKELVLEKKPSWRQALSDVRAAFPAARLFIWRYEDYEHLSGQVLQNLCGDAIDASLLREPGSPQIRPTASGEAVSRMLAAADEGGLKAMVDCRIDIQEAFPKGRKWGSYDPWSPKDRARLDAAYARDWEKICADNRYEILAPDLLMA